MYMDACGTVHGLSAKALIALHFYHSNTLYATGQASKQRIFKLTYAYFRPHFVRVLVIYSYFS